VVYAVLSRLIIYLALTTVLIGARWPFVQTWLREHVVVVTIIIFGVFTVTVTAFRWPSARGLMMALWAWLRSPIKRERIALAEVHAAIVGILFAAIWAYTTHLISTVWELEDKAIIEAKGNDGRVWHVWWDPGGRYYDTSTLRRRKQAIKYLDLIGIGVSDENLPSDPVARGAEALHIMAALSTSAPFQPIPRTDTQGIQHWVEETEPVTDELLWILKARSPRLQAIMNQFFEAVQANPPFREFPQHFTDHVKQVDKLMQTLRSQLEDITAFRQRRLSRKSLMMPLGVVAVAFVSGVLVPLLWRRTWSLFTLAIPIAAYVYLFTDLVRQIISVTSGAWW
jgi:hypothetical protein